MHQTPCPLLHCFPLQGQGQCSALTSPPGREVREELHMPVCLQCLQRHFHSVSKLPRSVHWAGNGTCEWIKRLPSLKMPSLYRTTIQVILTSDCSSLHTAHLFNVHCLHTGKKTDMQLLFSAHWIYFAAITKRRTVPYKTIIYNQKGVVNSQHHSFCPQSNLP